MMIEHLKTTLPSILSDYHRQRDLRSVPIIVDYLRPLFEARGFVDKFEWQKYKFPAKHIAAMITFYRGQTGVYGATGDFARIQFSDSLNFCWQRFAICKEMWHTILDQDPRNRVTNVDGLLTLSELLVSNTSAFMASFCPAKTEDEAEILALETLFPLELRSHHQDQYVSGLITDHQLALRYRIPEEYVRLGMYSKYISEIGKVREQTLVDL